MSDRDVMKWLVVGLLVAVAVVSLVFARRMVAPIDDLITQQACSDHGTDLSREVIESERANRWALSNRTDGYCLYGPIVDLEADEEDRVPGSEQSDEASPDDPAAIDTLQVSLADIDTGGFYQAVKAMGVILQLGVASLAVRLVADPLLDRFVRRRA